jgi:hypothetical protein
MANLQRPEEIEASPTRLAPSRWLRFGFWACIVISIAVVVRRVVALAYPPHSAPPQLAALDGLFASHATLTLAHILPALAFVVVSPFFVLWSDAERTWPERLLFPLGAVVGITAYAMSIYSVGGWLERSAVLFFNTLFLFSLFCAYWHMRRGEWLLKRRWMMRAIVILLRHRLLDWLFHQYPGRRGLVAFQGQSGANREKRNASWVLSCYWIPPRVLLRRSAF